MSKKTRPANGSGNPAARQAPALLAHDCDVLAMLHEAAVHREIAEQQIAATVEHAREHLVPWADIAQILGVSRQAAQQRYGRPSS